MSARRKPRDTAALLGAAGLLTFSLIATTLLLAATTAAIAVASLRVRMISGRMSSEGGKS